MGNASSQKTDFDKDWDGYSVLIDDRKDSPGWAVIREARESHWRELVQLPAGSHILDAGCGNGDYTRLALQDGARVWAFDLSREMVSATERRLAAAGLEAEELQVASVLEIPYPDARFDVVLCFAVIDHVPDERRLDAVRELVRVLKPGGTLYINTPNRYAYTWRAGHWLMRQLGRFPKGKIRWLSPGELQALCIEADCSLGRSLGLELLPPVSGIYTSDLERLTVLPESLISVLDRWYLRVEQRLRRIDGLKPFCFHYFLEATKRD
ncbi:MAG: methyltransferase domain-containing protein [Acidimicrobiia bacterium]|nr:methyltransferase domain-containing protein [Acidimicrobiia bacterium]